MSFDVKLQTNFVEIFYVFLLTFCTAIFFAVYHRALSPRMMNVVTRLRWRAAHSVVVMLENEEMACMSSHLYQLWTARRRRKRPGQGKHSVPAGPDLLSSKGDADH